MAILEVSGTIQTGSGAFKRRMANYPEVFARAVGEKLFPGTLNVCIDHEIPVNQHFRINGEEIDEPEQDLIFEICRVNGIWAYRIRPFQPATGRGGHGDHIIEVTSKHEIPDAKKGRTVTIQFFRSCSSVHK